MSELFHKEVNAQKNSGVQASSRKPMKKCAMKMKIEVLEEKRRWALKIFLIEGRSL